MKVKSESEVAQSCLTLSDTMDCSLPGSSVHGIFQARVLEWGAIAFSKSHLVVSNSLRSCGLYSPWNSPGQNTGVASLPLLQGIFPTQESNSGLLHCRWIFFLPNLSLYWAYTIWHSISIQSMCILSYTLNHAYITRNNVNAIWMLYVYAYVNAIWIAANAV